MPAPALEVADLVIRYPDRAQPAVDHISFVASPACVLAVLGPNGAGKTSTIEALEGYKRPTSGTVRVLGLDPITQAADLMPRVGVMLQRNGVYLSMGPAQVLKLFAAYYGSRARSADEVLDLVGLRSVAKTPWRRLSGGEQQRLSLGMAVIGKPEVLFLDEPTAGMDPAARQTLWGVIRSLREDGATVVLTTHYLDEAERLADQVVIIDHGKVVAAGSPDQLRSAGTEDIRFSASAGLHVAALTTQLGGAQVAELTPGEYRASVAPTPQHIAAITSWLAQQNVTLGDLRGGRQRLEDVFVKLTQEPSVADAERGSRQSRRRSRKSPGGPE
jgi:ABC-2 type transport system ATP-binding protein